MGGKRPDQHNIDPGEAGATDYKFREDDDRVHAEEKQKLQGNPADQPMIPKSGVNPALRDLQDEERDRSENA